MKIWQGGHSWNTINTPDILFVRISKLANGLIYRWNGYGYNIREKHECEPYLSDLIEFID